MTLCLFYKEVVFMYLSRVEIDDNNRRKIKSLTHLGAYHNWVENCFPGEKAKDERLRHLWRIDQLNGRRYLLLVSQEKPDLDNLCSYGVTGTAILKNYQPFINNIEQRTKLRFRLTANPTYRTDGKVYPHITVEQQKNWLLKRAAGAGFAIPANKFDIVSREWPILYHNHQQVKLSRVSFEGILEVTDIDVFRETLTQGIGREKAYGMGLLTVIPLVTE